MKSSISSLMFHIGRRYSILTIYTCDPSTRERISTHTVRPLPGQSIEQRYETIKEKLAEYNITAPQFVP